MAYNIYPVHPLVKETQNNNSSDILIRVYGNEVIDGDTERTYSYIKHSQDDLFFEIDRDLPDPDDISLDMYNNIGEVVDQTVYRVEGMQGEEKGGVKKYSNILSIDNPDTGDTDIFATDKVAAEYLDAMHKSKQDFMKEHNITSNAELAKILRSTEASKVIHTSSKTKPIEEFKHITNLLDGFDAYIAENVHKKYNTLESRDLGISGTSLNEQLLDHTKSSRYTGINKENNIDQLLSLVSPIIKDKYADAALFKILIGETIKGYKPPLSSPLFSKVFMHGDITALLKNMC